MRTWEFVYKGRKEAFYIRKYTKSHALKPKSGGITLLASFKSKREEKYYSPIKQSRKTKREMQLGYYNFMRFILLYGLGKM